MSTVQAPAIKLEKTIDLEQVFRDIEHGHVSELLGIFDKWPISEIREKVIRQLLARPPGIPSHLIERLEERIRQLRASYERDYWKGLLSWYVANSSLGPEAVKAIEFAIGFSKEFREEWEVAKEVSGRLKRDPELYWEVPSLRHFFDALISGLAFFYFSSQWVQVERAIRRIVQVRDITYLPQIEKLLDLFEQGIYKLALYEGDEFTSGQNLQFLKDAVRILKQAQQEQTPDLNVVVGSYLRKQAGLAGSVIIRIEYQQESDTSKLMLPFRVSVKLELTDPAEAAKFAPVLEKYHIEWWGEGFTGTKFLGVDEIAGGYFGPKEVPSDGRFQCSLSAFPSRGSNRFWLTFLDGKKKFAEVARYLIVG